jgi:hypothetical protein
MSADQERRLADWMYSAHRYYNGLVELENLKRANLDAIRRAMSPELAEADAVVSRLEAERDAAVAEVQAYKGRERAEVASEDLRMAVLDARAKLKLAYAARSAAMKALHATPAWKAAQKAETAAHFARQKAAYNASAVWWGTKLALAEAAERAASSTPFGPVRFRRWDRDGRLSAQIQNGLSAADVYAGEDTRVRIESIPGHPNVKLVHLRLASDRGRPVWTTLRVKAHRPLPEGGTVKWVHLVRRQGWHTRKRRDEPPTAYDDWSVQFVVSVPDRPVEDKDGKCGIDVGWRLRPDGSLRVACWADDRGGRGELTLPPDLLALWTRREEAQAERDRLFNAERDRLADWIDASRESLPEAFLEATTTVRQWRGYNRLHTLLTRWDELTTPDGTGQDADIAPRHNELLEWRDADVRLEMAFVSCGRRAIRRRLDVYRKFAAEMGGRYGRLAVEKLAVARMARDDRPEEDNPTRARKEYMRAAAVGLLLQCLRMNGRCPVAEFAPHGTTSRCHACWSDQTFDRSRLTHTCTACGAEWDQDENAALNLLTMLAERPDDGDTDDPTRPPDDQAGQAVTKKKPKKTLLKPRRKATLSQTIPQSV